jgi:hypothetical protein
MALRKKMTYGDALAYTFMVASIIGAIISGISLVIALVVLEPFAMSIVIGFLFIVLAIAYIVMKISNYKERKE